METKLLFVMLWLCTSWILHNSARLPDLSTHKHHSIFKDRTKVTVLFKYLRLTCHKKHKRLSMENYKSGDSKIVQWVKALVAQSDNPSPIPTTRMVERNDFHKWPSVLHVDAMRSICMLVHTLKKKKEKL